MAPVVEGLVKRTSSVHQLRKDYSSILAMLLYYFFVLCVLATLSHTKDLYQVSSPKTLVLAV
jgi:uncharacterized membrane protein affecting hemolysin expression